MHEIEKVLYQEKLEVAKTMLELSEYLQEQAEMQLKISEDYLKKAESADNEAKAQVRLGVSEIAYLESDENGKLSLLLSKKAHKFLDEVESYL